MADTLSQQLRIARPSLKLVSPMSYWFIMLMGLFNIILGLSFILAIDQDRLSSPFLIVNNVFTWDFWGFIFLILGIFKLGTLKKNSWKWARRSLIFGVSIKSTWMVALIIRMLVSPGTLFVALLWATVAITQMLCYIYFLPPTEPSLPNGGMKKK